MKIFLIYSAFILFTNFIQIIKSATCPNPEISRCQSNQCSAANPLNCEVGFCKPDTVSSQTRINDGTCKCPDGYTDQYDSNNNNENIGCKIDCAHQCETCDLGTKDDGLCTICKDNTYHIPQCIYPKQGWYQIQNGLPSNWTAAPCAPKCNYCENNSTNCIPGDNGEQKCLGMNRNQATCDCDPKYHDNEGKLQDCESCPLNCLSCKNSNLCLECDGSLHLERNLFSGQCDCKPGYRMFDTEIGCEKCYMLSDVCVKVCPQNTVQNEIFGVCETLEYDMISNSTLIIILGVLIGVIQISLCCFVYICLQRKHDVMEKALFEEQLKIKQQRDFIYKNLDSYQNDQFSKSGTSPLKERAKSNLIDDSHSDLSQSNIQSSQVNLFNKRGSGINVQSSQQNIDLADNVRSDNEINLDDGDSSSQVSGSQASGSLHGARRKRRKQRL